MPRDPYDSLCTTYNPSRCSITGEMILRNHDGSELIKLISNSEGSRSARIVGNLKTTKSNAINKSYSYESLDDTGEFKSFFIELETAIQKEKQSHFNKLNDTLYYRTRTSAKLIEDSVIVFTEQYNYSIPELNEYYVLTRCSDRYKLYVYNRSAFMAWYLSEDKYKGFFKSLAPTPKETYDSLEQLQGLIDGISKRIRPSKFYFGTDATELEEKMYESISTSSSKESPSKLYAEKEHLQIRLRAFKRLMEDVDALYHKLQNREEFIQNFKNIYEKPEDVLTHYSLESDFDCKYDDENGDISECLSSRQYHLPDGTEVTITLDDILRAFELGFSDIHEICRIKAKFGSIEAVL